MPQCGLSTCDDDTEELQQHNGHRALITGGPSIARDKKRQIQKLEGNV
jgi:hypothetical protein